MNTYGPGTRLFCDFTFGGKPKGVCLEVIKPGNGQNSAGVIRVQLTETVRAYTQGEVLDVNTFIAVPCAEELPLKRGQFFGSVLI